MKEGAFLFCKRDPCFTVAVLTDFAGLPKLVAAFLTEVFVVGMIAPLVVEQQCEEY
jgi:hypothetical protein